MEKKIFYLDEIEELKDFDKYALDMNGNVWSFKYKQPRILKPFLTRGYPAVKLRDKYGRKKYFYVHKLVALMFLPIDDTTRKVRHKNKNKMDNDLLNIEWIFPKPRKVVERQSKEEVMFRENIFTRFEKLHRACQKKGIKTGDTIDFTNKMIDEAIEEYIIRYGLRKVMSDL
tara:strand:- start:63 stop:578 length:516 start_codon:yes stop_codon:yes gene_type:complete